MSESGEQLFEQLMRFRPDGLTANGWAVKAGVSRTIWADLRRHGNPSRRTLEKLLAAADSSLAEFEALRVIHSAESVPSAHGALAESGRGWGGAPVLPIPLYATSPVGEWGKAGSGIELHSVDRSIPVGRVDRPMALAGDREAYAVIVTGEAMWPRFRAGRHLLVAPGASVEAGDDVLVRLVSGQILIKELVRRTARVFELRQFNPDLSFAVTSSEVEAVERVVGEAL